MKPFTKKIWITASCLMLLSFNLKGQSPKLVLPIAPSSLSKAVDVSSDDRLLLTEDGTNSYLWDLATGVLLKTLWDGIRPVFVSASKIQMDDPQRRQKRYFRKVFDYDSREESEIKNNFNEYSLVEISNDLKKGIVGLPKSNPTSLFLFSFLRPTGLKQLNGQYDKVEGAYFSDDGKRVLSVSFDKTVIIWDAVKGRLIKRMKLIDEYHIYGGFNRRNNLFLTKEQISESGHYSYAYKIWHIDSGRCIQKVVGDYFCFSRDKKYLAIVSKQGLVSVISFETGKILHSFNCDPDSNFIKFNLDGSKIFTGDLGDIKYWEVRSGMLLNTINFRARSVTQNNKGDKVIFIVDNGSKGQSIVVWDLVQNRVISNFRYGIQNIAPNSYLKNNDSLLTVTMDNGSLHVRDIKSNKVIVSIRDDWDDRIAFFNKISPKKTWIVTFGSSGCTIWNFRTGEKQQEYKEFGNVQHAEFSPDEKLFAIALSKDSTIKIFDLDSGTLLQSFSPGFKFDSNFEIDNTSTKIRVSESSNKSTKVYDLVSGNLIFSKKYNKIDFYIKDAMFSPDGNFLVVSQDRDHISLYSFKEKGMAYTVEIPSQAVQPWALSPDGKRIAICTKSCVKILLINSGAVIDSLTDNSVQPSSVEFSLDNQKLLTGSENGLTIWNLHTGKPEKRISPELEPDPFWNRLDFKEMELVQSYIGKVSFIDLNTGKTKYSIFENRNSLGNTEHIVMDGEGYYRCDPDVAKFLHYITKDLRVISFEQLDAKFNRPDKVLAALGSKDTALIKSYQLAYQKRIEKLGIDTTAFDETYNVPVADFVNRVTIKPVQMRKKMKLRIKGGDQGRKLDQFNVWVNQVPVYGLKGISLRRRNRKELDTTIVVQLSAGENRIETSIRNDNGIESYRIPLTVTYNPAVKPKEKVYFIGIGIDKFGDQSRNLMYSAKDIIVLAEKMKKKYGDDVVIDTLINTSVTVENVKALKARLLKTTVNDKVIAAYSGHGLLDSLNNYYLSTYSVDFGKPENGGLPYDELENILDGIPARKKLLLLDACHSGEVDRAVNKNENQSFLISAGEQHTSTVKEAGKGVSAQPKPDKNKIGLSNSFELMQTLFVNVGKNTGTTVFAAAAGSQAAFEKNNLQHSVFSYFIIKAFDQSKSQKLSELKKTITENVVKESDQKQIPTSRSETIAYDWALW